MEGGKDVFKGGDRQFFVAGMFQPFAPDAAEMGEIEFPQFGEGVFTGLALAVGGAVDRPVMEQDRDPVLGQPQVKLNDVCPEFDGFTHGEQGVFRIKSASAAVGGGNTFFCGVEFCESHHRSLSPNLF